MAAWSDSGASCSFRHLRWEVACAFVPCSGLWLPPDCDVADVDVDGELGAACFAALWLFVAEMGGGL